MFIFLCTKAAGEVSNHLYKVWKKVCTQTGDAKTFGLGLQTHPLGFDSDSHIAV